MVHEMEKTNQLVDPDLTQTLEPADKDVKTTIVSVQYVPKARGSIKHIKVRPNMERCLHFGED